MRTFLALFLALALPLGAAAQQRQYAILSLVGDELIYQDLDALIEDVRSVNPAMQSFEASCFSGIYITGDITQEYLDGVEASRRDDAKEAAVAEENQLDLDLEVVD